MNGWYNYQTWNVALYIQNEYPIYSLAREWVQDRKDSGYETCDYDTFRHTLTELVGAVTPDGVSWSDPTLDNDELTEMLSEL